jgi:hypothetical protein
MAVSTKSESSLADIEKADEGVEGTPARDSVVAMITRTCEAANRWKCGDMMNTIVERNKGCAPGQKWKVLLQGEDLKAVLPQHILDYIAKDGDTEEDREVARLLAAADAVTMQPSRSAISSDDTNIVAVESIADELTCTPTAEAAV